MRPTVVLVKREPMVTALNSVQKDGTVTLTARVTDIETGDSNIASAEYNMNAEAGYLWQLRTLASTN